VATDDVVYMVPVIVEVDLETGLVERVNVDDENARLDPDAGNDPASVQVAENAEWPAWEFGF